MNVTCRKPWQPNHQVLGKSKNTLQEVVFDEDSKVELKPEIVVKEIELEGQGGEHQGASGGTLAALSRTPRYHSFHVRGVLQGQRVMVLIYSGATHNFIDEGLGYDGIEDKKN